MVVVVVQAWKRARWWENEHWTRSRWVDERVGNWVGAFLVIMLFLIFSFSVARVLRPECFLRKSV